MARYFMGGSRLEGWERMMMDSSRRPPAHMPQKKPPRGQFPRPRPRERENRRNSI